MPGQAATSIGVSGALLDASVLAVVARGDTYGYALTQQITERLHVAESTIYPVLRRLEKDNCLTCYDVPTDGRNRRYYACTETGRVKLNDIINQWEDFKAMLDSYFQETS